MGAILMIYSNKSATSVAYASNLVIKATGGTLYSIVGYNSCSVDQFIQVHDTRTLPTDGAIPVIIFKIPSNSNFSFDLGERGRCFSKGIVICNSSTGATKTIGSNDCWFDVQYV